MASKTHTFSESNAKGKLGESIITEYFTRKGYTVLPASMEQNKSGYDLLVTNDKGKEYYIEVKTDSVGETTHNLFWEMEVSGKPGWTQKYTEDSKVLICVLLPVSRRMYIFSAKSLPRMTTYIEENFPNSKKYVDNVVNQGTPREVHYVAWGYLLPFSTLSKFSKVYSV